MHVSRALAVVALHWFEARVRMSGAWRNRVAAYGALSPSDSVDQFLLLLLVDGVDAHWHVCRWRGGHRDRALAPRGGLLVRFGCVPGGKVRGYVVGLAHLLLGSDESACTRANHAVHLDDFQHQGGPAFLCEGVPILGGRCVVVVLLHHPPQETSDQVPPLGPRPGVLLRVQWSGVGVWLAL